MPKAAKEEGLGGVVPLSSDKGIWRASLELFLQWLRGKKTRRKN